LTFSSITAKENGYRVKPGMTSVGYSFVLCCMPAISMLVLLSVASCTSNQAFNEVFAQVTQLLSLSGTSLSAWLITHSGMGHLMCYAMLSLALSGVFSRQRMFVAPLVAVSFGFLMEGVQIFIPTRGASLMDIGINILGVAIGFALYWLWANFRPFKRIYFLSK